MHKLGSPFDMLHRVLSRALTTDLPSRQFYRRDMAAIRDLTEEQREACLSLEGEKGHQAWPGSWAPYRPDLSEISIEAMFPQTWGSSALGFPGLGAAAITHAYTIVVRGPDGDLAVYFGGRFAYLLPPKLTEASGSAEQKDNFWADVGAKNLADVGQAATRYGAVLP